MRILVNALSATVGGGVTALKRLLPEMLAIDGGRHRYLLLVSAQQRATLDLDHERLTRIEVSTPRRSLLRALDEQLVVPFHALRHRADVLLSPAGLACLASPVPQVLIFQNAAPFTPEVVEQYRYTRNPRRMPILRRMGILSAKVATRVVFISDGQRDTIFPQLGISAAKTSRIYLGRDPAFSPEASSQAAPLLARLGLSRPYALSISHFYRYQNLVELTEGFAQAAKASALPKEMKLVLAGPEVEVDYAARVRETARRQGVLDRLVFPGSIPYADLPALYAAADVFLFATICESFPITLIEALGSGVPTLASNRPPMPELAGIAARYFDPSSPKELAQALGALSADAGLRQRLSTAGVSQAKLYGWEATGRQLLNLLEAVGAGA